MQFDSAQRHLRGHIFFYLVQIGAAVCMIYWLRHLPAPGYAIGLLAVLAAVMTIHGDMRPWQKAVWMLLMGAFLFLEFRAIAKDRSDYVAIEASKRAEERRQFQAIADGFNATIENSNKQFAATMARTDRVIGEEEKIARMTNRNLEQLTGGGQFCFLSMELPVSGSNGQPVYQLDVQNPGSLPLDICHVVIQPEGRMQVIVNEQLGPLPPGKVSGVNGTLGTITQLQLPQGSYYVHINTRNDRFYEFLRLRPIASGNEKRIEVHDQSWKIVYSEP